MATKHRTFGHPFPDKATLLGEPPLWKMMEWVRQLGWWHSQYDGIVIKVHGSKPPTSILLLSVDPSQQVAQGWYQGFNDVKMCNHAVRSVCIWALSHQSPKNNASTRIIISKLLRIYWNCQTTGGSWWFWLPWKCWSLMKIIY